MKNYKQQYDNILMGNDVSIRRITIRFILLAILKIETGTSLAN